MHGVSIQHLTLPKLKIERLNIKLDKRLIVTAHKIEYQRDSKSKTSMYEINKIISYFKYLNPIFKSISLKNIIYNDEKVNLLYKDDIFYLNSKFLTIDANVTQDKSKIIKMNINQMILKDYQLEFRGNLSIDLRKKIYSYDGKFDILNIDGNIKMNIDKNILYYDINTSSFDTLSPIMKYLKSKVFIEPLAREWIYKKITAKKYRLERLKGKFNLKTKEFYPGNMKGSAIAQNAIVKFSPTVNPAYVKTIKIKLRDNTLFFKLTKAKYEKKSIGINDIHIYNILTSKNGIVVDINSKTILDKYIHNILKSFGIKIPITQTDGKNRSDLKLDVKFRPYSIKANGKFIIKNSHFTLVGIPFYTKNANIRLDNFDVLLKNCNLTYGKLFDIDLTGIFKTKEKTFDGNIDINSFFINIKKSPILHITNLKKQPVNLKIGTKKSVINLKDLDTKIIFEKGRNKFILKDILRYKNFSNFIKTNNINQGLISIETKDFKNYDAKLKIFGLKTPFVYKNKKIKDFDIDMSTDGNKIKASANDGKFKLSYDKHIILNLKKLDILLDNNDSIMQKNINISINGKIVNFLVKDLNSTILSDSFTYNKFKHQTRFYSVYMNSTLSYE